MVTKVPIQYFAHPRGQVYIGNDPRWIDTVQKTSDYLGTHLTKDETFFAFPYDPIYYYLTARKSPTRQLIFFNHINVPPEQEQAIIKELENAKVNYIVLSNRISSVDQSLGVFGTTYCPILKKYMDDHFTVIEHWGDWQGEPGWSWNYGTVILKRK